jgi:hypothetical protein
VDADYRAQARLMVMGKDNPLMVVKLDMIEHC